MRSALALVVAVAMVAGAWYFRYGRNGGGDDPLGPLTPNEPVTIICSSDLDSGTGTSICDTLAKSDGVEVVVEEASVTAGRISTTETVMADAWLVTAPWPQIVNDNRQRAVLPLAFEDVGEPLARSPIVLAMWEDRVAAMSDSCPRGSVDWQCIGDAAGRPWAEVGGQTAWGLVKPSHDHPQRGAGLIVLGAIAANRLQKISFSRADIEGDAFFSWFSNLEEKITSFGSGRARPIDEMITIGPSKYDAVGTLEAFAGPLMARSQRGGTVELLYPQPLVTADVVLAPLAGADGEGAQRVVAEVVPAALAESGWRVEGEQLVEGVPSEPALPDVTEAPSAGVLEALRAMWEETR